MELPGGLLCDGRLRRDYRFRPLTGKLERGIAESGIGVDGLPQQVSRILAANLARVAGRPVNRALVRELSAGDRQYLLLQLEARIDAAPRWITLRCRGCEALIQFPIQPGSLPVKPAGAGYPQTDLELSLGRVRLRVPNGGDEEAVALAPADESRLPRLLARLLSVNGRAVSVERLSEADLVLIDARLDAMAPQPGLVAQVACPACRLTQDCALDAYAWISRDGRGLERDVHTLALHYHWSERDILALPRHRRERYLQLIDQSRGRYRAADLIRGQQGGIG